MAVIRIGSSNDLSSLIKYVVNPKKTREKLTHVEGNQINDSSVVGKKSKREYVTVFGSTSVETAAEEFNQTKELRGKSDGRACYHISQSFAEGEVDAETAHEIGVKLAKNLWTDRFQVLVATHCNTGHYHNHIIINSVSERDGYKLAYKLGYVIRIKEESDRICREYGLSVINDPQFNSKSYYDWMSERGGKDPVKDSIREAIEASVRCSVNIEGFCESLDNLGFVIDREGKNPLIKHKCSLHYISFRSLGKGYTVNDILDRIDMNYSPEKILYSNQDSPHKIFSNETEKGLDADYRCFVNAISIAVSNPEKNRYLSFLMSENVRYFERFSAESRFLTENHIKTDEDLKLYSSKKQTETDALLSERHKLRNALKMQEYFGNKDLILELKEKIKIKNEEVKRCKTEIKYCDSVAENYGMVKQKLETVRQEKFKGKEKLKDEYVIGSGRSDCENDPQRH